MILALFFLTLFGLVGELLLLEHYEGPWQMLPLALMGFGTLTLLIFLVTKSKPKAQVWTKRLFQISMLLVVIGGMIGVGMHYQGNAEFELEMYPGMKGFELFWESAKGATPMLAPGALTGLGLLGLIYAMFPSKNESQIE